MKFPALAFTALLLPVTAVQAAPDTSPAKVVDLRVEFETNPTAVNSPLPRFSWRIETEERGWLQKSYHILVASSPELLADDKGDLWNSGETYGRNSWLVAFGGAPLRSGQQVHWKVRTKGKEGRPTPWSTPATCTIKLGGLPEFPSPLFSPDAPRLSSFDCSDPNLNAIYKAAAAALPQITSLRDIGLCMRAAGYHVPLAPRGQHYLRHLAASIDGANFYPGNLPVDGTYGSTNSDAAVNVVHAQWWATGDDAVTSRYWPNIYDYIAARKSADPKGVGTDFGGLPDDTLPNDDPTPVGFIHQTTQALNIRLALEIGRLASHSPFEMRLLEQSYATIGLQFRVAHLNDDGSLKYRSLTAHLLALRSGLLKTDEQKDPVIAGLLTLLSEKDSSALLETPIASTNLFPVLTWIQQNDRAIAIAIEQDPKTLSPIALLGMSEWLISMVAGIQTNEPGFRDIRIQPRIPESNSLSFARAQFETLQGKIVTHWARTGDVISFDVIIPPNTTALIQLPVGREQTITESSEAVAGSKRFFAFRRDGETVSFRALPGAYEFTIGD